MNLRPFSTEEVANFKRDAYGRYDYTRLVHELLAIRVDEAYDNYVRDFKYSLWNPFDFKPETRKKMIQRLVGSHGSIAEVSNTFILKHTDHDTPFSIFYFLGDPRAELQKEHDKDLIALARYCNSNVLFESDKDRDFLTIFDEYAVEPHTFTHDEILRIHRLRGQGQYIARELARISKIINGEEDAATNPIG